MDAHLYTTAFVIVINKAAYDEISTAQREVIDEHCTSDWAARVAGPFDEFERAGEIKLRTESSGLYELTSDQLALWKRAAEPLRKEWFDTVRKIGVNPITAMDGLRDQLVRQNAAY